MEALHSLLKRQVKRHLGEPAAVPEELRGFLRAVSEAYREFDADSEMLERSLELSSQELMQANAEMRAIFQAIPDLLFRVDPGGVILDIKAGATGDLVIKRQELIGKRLQETLLLHVREDFCEALRRAGEEKHTVSIEYPMTVEGQEFFYEARLVPTPEGEIITLIRNITERKQSLRLLGSAVEQATDAIVITDTGAGAAGPRILFINPAFTKMTGYVSDEVRGKTLALLEGVRTDKALLERLRESHAAGGLFKGEFTNYRKDGTEFPMEWQVAPIRNSNGVITNFLTIQRDITERKVLEVQLFQAQKLETVGKLAGGIAHEFNSIMTAIIGQSDLLIEALSLNNPLSKNATEIAKAAQRAAALTRQLLAYGRKQLLQPETLDLNQVLSNMEGMFHHLMGREVEVCVLPGVALKGVEADAGQIQQVIMNMAINAHDAMPHGGKLTFETSNVTITRESAEKNAELKPGEFAMLAITDTGAGMSPEVKARLFEPFFTTKGVGKGTGLGLATCYGILKQSGGNITVESALGRGTTFRIYLPEAQKKTAAAAPRKAIDLPHGKEKILLVEEDPALRQMTAGLLSRLGYTVATASGIQALGQAAQQGTAIDLLFAGIGVPEAAREELSERVRSLYPGARLLFTCTYTDPGAAQESPNMGGVGFLKKPFTPSTLALKVREMLDAEVLQPAA